MSKSYIQPPELFPSQRFGFTQVIQSPPGSLVFISGQTAMDASFRVENEDDVGAQAEVALANLDHALKAAGAKRADLVSMRIYVVDYQPEKMELIGGRLQRFFEGIEPCTQTLIGVQTLATPKLKIEIETMAVISD